MSRFQKKMDSKIRISKLGIEIAKAIGKVNKEYPELNEREVTICLLQEIKVMNEKELNELI